MSAPQTPNPFDMPEPTNMEERLAYFAVLQTEMERRAAAAKALHQMLAQDPLADSFRRPRRTGSTCRTCAGSTGNPDVPFCCDRCFLKYRALARHTNITR